jgi:hypothetical protein
MALAPQVGQLGPPPNKSDMNECVSGQYDATWNVDTTACRSDVALAACSESITGASSTYERQCTCTPGKYINTGAMSDIRITANIFRVGTPFPGCAGM